MRRLLLSKIIFSDIIIYISMQSLLCLFLVMMHWQDMMQNLCIMDDEYHDCLMLLSSLLREHSFPMMISSNQQSNLNDSWPEIQESKKERNLDTEKRENDKNGQKDSVLGRWSVHLLFFIVMRGMKKTVAIIGCGAAGMMLMARLVHVWWWKMSLLSKKVRV